MSTRTIPILDRLVEREMTAAGLCRRLAEKAKSEGRIEDAIAQEARGSEHERRAIEVCQCSEAYQPPPRIEWDRIGLADGEAERAERAMRRRGVVNLEHGRVVEPRRPALVVALLCALGLAVCAALALVGCGPADTQAKEAIRLIDYGGSLYMYHDDSRGVTCWVYPGHGISCLPDSAIGAPAPERAR